MLARHVAPDETIAVPAVSAFSLAASRLLWPLPQTTLLSLCGRSLDFIRAHLSAPHTLASLATRAAMSTRTLQREFTSATGLAPYAWLVGERIERAKELLETTHLKAQDVAARVGMGSAESLRHHFRQRVGTTPAQYRRRFWRAAGQ